MTPGKSKRSLLAVASVDGGASVVIVRTSRRAGSPYPDGIGLWVIGPNRCEISYIDSLGPVDLHVEWNAAVGSFCGEAESVEPIRQKYPVGLVPEDGCVPVPFLRIVERRRCTVDGCRMPPPGLESQHTVVEFVAPMDFKEAVRRHLLYCDGAEAELLLSTSDPSVGRRPSLHRCPS